MENNNFNNNNGNNGWKKNMGYNNNPRVINDTNNGNGEQLMANNTVSSGFGPFNWVKSNPRTCAYAGGTAVGVVIAVIAGRKIYNKYFKKSNKKSEEKPQEAAAANDANKGK